MDTKAQYEHYNRKLAPEILRLSIMGDVQLLKTRLAQTMTDHSEYPIIKSLLTSQLARAYLANGEFEAALEQSKNAFFICTAAANTTTQNSLPFAAASFEAQHVSAQCLIKMGEPEKALTLYQRLAEWLRIYNPGMITERMIAHRQCAALLKEQQKFPEAIKEAQTVLTLSNTQRLIEPSFFPKLQAQVRGAHQLLSEVYQTMATAQPQGSNARREHNRLARKHEAEAQKTGPTRGRG